MRRRTKKTSSTQVALRQEAANLDLRAKFPDGRSRRVYYTSPKRNRVWGQVCVNGRREYVCGRLRRGRIVLDAR